MSLRESGSLLVITPISGGRVAPELTPFSARGLTQTLVEFGGSASGALIRETIDGRTIDLTPPWMRKYESTVTCTDGSIPILDGAFRGVLCSVQCACELSYWTGGTPDRPVVPGSEREEGGVTFYRPELVMRVTAIHRSFQEWQAKNAWQVDLREYEAP